MGRTFNALIVVLLMLLSGCIDPTDPLGKNQPGDDDSTMDTEPEPEPEPEPELSLIHI